VSTAPLPPVSRFRYPPIDYSAPEEAIVYCEGAIRTARIRPQSATTPAI
jgi:hypothetical protein